MTLSEILCTLDLINSRPITAVTDDLLWEVERAWDKYKRADMDIYQRAVIEDHIDLAVSRIMDAVY